MKITDTCCCGAEFSAEDESPPVCGVAHVAWIKVHEACRQAKALTVWDVRRSTGNPDASMQFVDSVPLPRGQDLCTHVWRYPEGLPPKEGDVRSCHFCSMREMLTAQTDSISAWVNVTSADDKPEETPLDQSMKARINSTECRACEVLYALYCSTGQTPKDYNEATELFILLHDGKDHCYRADDKPEEGQ